MNIDNYLYEIIEDYKYSNSEEERNEIFNSFCSSIWSNKNKRRIYDKSIKFRVNNNLLNTEIGRIFDTWSIISYKGYKSTSKENDWISLIRQKINNLYTRYFDKEVILKKDYMELLKTPKNLYFNWLNGSDIDVDELTNIIDSAMNHANELKYNYQKQKMDLSWEKYKIVIEGFLKKIFNNCKLVDDYESDNIANKYIHGLATEDNFYIKYICKSLESYMLNYQKEYHELHRGRNKKYKHCNVCGKLIEKTNNRILYCNDCKHKKQLEWQRKSMNKIRNK